MNNNVTTTRPLELVANATLNSNFGWGSSSFFEVLLLASGGTLAVLTILLSCFQFFNHLTNWRDADLQKCYLRIVLLAPVYSLFSWLSVVQTTQSADFDTIRAAFEGYTLWTFFSLMLFALGGEQRFHELYCKYERLREDDCDNRHSNRSDGLDPNADTTIGTNTHNSTETIDPEQRKARRSIDCYVLPPCNVCDMRKHAKSSTNRLFCYRCCWFRDTYSSDYYCCCCRSCQTCVPCGRVFTFRSSNTALNCWKLCLLQFGIMKTGLSSVTAYSEIRHAALSTDRWVKPMALISVTIAMWALLSAYISFSAVSARVRDLHVPTKFIVIKLAIFMTVAQELCLHVLVAWGIVSSPYCKWVGPSVRCLDLMGFQTPSARRGVRTVASLVVLEMFFLQFTFLRYFSFVDKVLGGISHHPDRKIGLVEFFFKPIWNIENTNI